MCMVPINIHRLHLWERQNLQSRTANKLYYRTTQANPYIVVIRHYTFFEVIGLHTSIWRKLCPFPWSHRSFPGLLCYRDCCWLNNIPTWLSQTMWGFNTHCMPVLAPFLALYILHKVLKYIILACHKAGTFGRTENVSNPDSNYV